VEVADVVFAKQELLAYCRKKGIACRPFENFGDVQREVAELLESGSLECEAEVGAAR
jgi:2-hydroxy-3-keto-5-methylthiopentenyl-1-phosphate phosphatase